jgi:hypothetical protein
MSTAEQIVNRALQKVGRDPRIDPKPGDIVRSDYPSIGERHVIHANECGVSYWRIRPNGRRYDGYCLPGIWQKWCRGHRAAIIQTGG